MKLVCIKIDSHVFDPDRNNTGPAFKRKIRLNKCIHDSKYQMLSSVVEHICFPPFQAIFPYLFVSLVY